MFIVSLFTALYGFLCVLVVLLVLIQRGKGNMGLGNVGGSNQAIFGSSGGQDIFQKITWICLVLLLGGSLVLSVLRGKQALQGYRSYQPVRSEQSAPISQEPFSEQD